MQFIKDNQGRALARIENRGTQQRMYSTNGTFLGHYDSRTDRTYLPNGTCIGVGNLTGTLIPR